MRHHGPPKEDKLGSFDDAIMKKQTNEIVGKNS